MVFIRSGKLTSKYKWFLKGVPHEVVNEYKLGGMLITHLLLTAHLVQEEVLC